MRHCRERVHWEDDALAMASDRCAAQASPVLPIESHTGRLTYPARRLDVLGAERTGFRLFSVTHVLSEVGCGANGGDGLR
jgi:hypothetical protein